MAGRKYQIAVIAKGDTSDAVRALGKLEQRAGKFSGKLRKTLAAGAMAGGAAIGAGLALAARTGYSELLEMEKVSAQTAAVLKSTGHAAGVTQKGVEGLATSLSRMSGVDDQAIQSGENLLLTFTNIGKKGGVFDAATKAALDMSVAMGTDMKSSAMQIGKALNDPAKGLTKLQRVGVTFTEQQKKQVEAMVKAGDAAGAQKIILGELNKEFGGSAKAFGQTGAGAVERAKRAFEDMSATLVQRFAPSATKVANKAAELSNRIAKWSETKQATKIFNDLTRVLNRLSAVVKKVAKFLLDHHKAVLITVAVLASLDLAIKAVRATLVIYGAAVKVVTAVTKAYRLAQWQLAAAQNATIVATIRQKAATVASTIAGKAAAVASKAWAAAQWVLNAALTANPIGLIILGIVALGAVLVLAYKKVGWFRKAINAVFGFVKKHWKTIAVLLTGPIGIAVALIVKHWTRIKSFVMGAVRGTINFVKAHWKTILAILTGPIGLAVLAIARNWNRIVGGVRALRSRISSAASGMWDGIKDAFRSALNWVVDKWNSFELKLTIPKKLGGGSIGIGTPNLPHFGRGTIANSPTVGVFGDDGAEALVPLGSSIRNRRDRARIMRQAGLAGTGTVVHNEQNFYVRNPVEDMASFMRRADFFVRTGMAV